MSATDALTALRLPGRWARLLARMKGPAIAAGLLLALNTLLYAGWRYPAAQALTAQRADNQAIRLQLQERLLYQQAQRDIEALAARFPSKKTLPQTIGRVSQLGRRTGVELPEMNFQPLETASPQWTRVDLQFNARGSYAGVRRFLAALEGVDEPYVIQSIVLDKEGQTGQIIARLVVSVYAREASP